MAQTKIGIYNSLYEKRNKTGYMSIGIILGFTLIFMIPISDKVFARPSFDSTELGQRCDGLYSVIENSVDQETQNQPYVDAYAKVYVEVCVNTYGP